MFLQIGNGVTVRKRDIIGIFDLDTASMSSDTKRFLREAEKKELLRDASGGELPRSFVLVGERRSIEEGDVGLGVRLSLISTAGLRLRLLRASEDSEE